MRGTGRRRRKGPSLMRRLVTVALQLGLLTGGVWAVWAGWRAATSPGSFPVRRLEVRGVTHASESEIRDRLSPAIGANLLTLDLDALRRAAEADPWVRSVTLRRRMPDTLAAEVRERRVAAAARIGGRKELVDEEGFVITPAGPEVPVPGPLLVGVDGVLSAARPARLRAGVLTLDAVRAVRPEFLDEVREVDLRDPRRVVLRLANGSEIWLPMGRQPRNLERYFRLRAEIDSVVGLVRYADLRWDDQIAVMPDGTGGK